MSDRSPRVSVIIPTYNRARYIHDAVTSVLSQTWSDLELIVVDDGSTDDTRGILKGFDDPRLRCIFQTNAGRSHARNVALRAARGEYITFLDSDDTYLPYKVERQVAFLDAQREFSMVYTAAACVNAAGQSLHFAYRAPVEGRIYPQIAFFRPLTITLPTVMVRREVFDRVGLFDEAMERFEDTDMWRRIARRYDIGAIDEVTCLLRTHNGNELHGQDPVRITAAIDYYVMKIFREDAGEISADVLHAGARRLYYHYGAALLSVAKFEGSGHKLIEKGMGFFAPKVSIVIPVYNGADYLAQAIESALRQTYWNIEILVVDDGSADTGATERIARSFGDRIRYFYKQNGGVASALNLGIQEMTGDYFSWLSHDDLYIPQKIERQVSFLSEQPEPESSVVYGDYSVFTDTPRNGNITKLPCIAPENFRFFITTENILHGCTLLIPRASFLRHGFFDERLRTTQDYDLWFRMAERERFVHQSGVLVHARAHPDQGTHKLKGIVVEECNELLAGFAARLSDDEVVRGTSRPLAAGYFEIAANLHRRGFHRAAGRALDLCREAVVRTAASGGRATQDARDLGDLVWRLGLAQLQPPDAVSTLVPTPARSGAPRLEVSPRPIRLFRQATGLSWRVFRRIAVPVARRAPWLVRLVRRR